MRVPTEQELRELAQRALDGEASLERLVAMAVFGKFRNPEPAWRRKEHHAAREAWKHAVWYYEELKADRRRRFRTDHLERTWTVLLVVAPEPTRWWLLRTVSWDVMASAMGASQTQAQYRYRAASWQFWGSPVDRRVVQAPCWGCGVPTSPHVLGLDGLCNACHAADVDPLPIDRFPTQPVLSRP